MQTSPGSAHPPSSHDMSFHLCRESRTGKMRLWMLASAAFVVATAEVDPDCVNEGVRRSVDRGQRVFDEVDKIFDIVDARINKVDTRSGVVELTIIWRGPHAWKNKTIGFQQDIRINSQNKVVFNGQRTELENVVFLDWTTNRERSASITVDEMGEEHLTVNTDNAATSCTLRLSFHAGHGRVMTDTEFGSFRFSPDGKLIMYSAEEPTTHWTRFLSRGYFQDEPKIERPTVYLYDVDKVQFRRLEQIPRSVSPGHLQWHPNGNYIVGVAWSNRDYNLLYPTGTNTMTRLFAVNVEDGSFHYLTDSGRNHFAPRFNPDGSSLVYMVNDLHSSISPKFYPGPYMMSSRLALMRWDDVMDHFSEGTFPSLSQTTLVSNSQARINATRHPVVLRDGHTFYGLYSVARGGDGHIPNRIFSADGKTVYVNVYELSNKRLLAVHTETRQITVHPEMEVRLLDTMSDVFVIKRGDLRHEPYLAFGRIRKYPPMPPTPRPPHGGGNETTEGGGGTWDTTTEGGGDNGDMEITTTTLAPDYPDEGEGEGEGEETTTTGPFGNSTTMDPCEHLLQELEMARVDRRDTVIDLSNKTHHVVVTPPRGGGGNSGNGGNGGGNGGNSGNQGVLRRQRPLPLARIEFFNVTNKKLLQNSAYFDLFSRPNFRWTQNTTDHTFFNSWLVKPVSDETSAVPLIVYLKGGPHSTATQGFDPKVERVLRLGMAYMAVNYRGSLGMGDDVLQAIVGNVGQMAVEDVHQAITRALSTHRELDPNKVVLYGYSYGGFLAAHLAAKYPSSYKVLILNNPLIDISAVRSLSKYVQGLLGGNHSNLFLPDNEYLQDGLRRSPLHLVNAINASTVIFVGENDKTLIPENQGHSLHNSLRVRNVTTKMYSYPGQGHAIVGHEEQRHMFSHAVSWVEAHWGEHDEDCELQTTTRPSDGRPGHGSTTRRPGSGSGSGGTKTTTKSTTTRRPSSSAASVSAVMNIVCLAVAAPLFFLKI